MRRLDTKAARLQARYIPKHTMAVKRPGIDAIVYIDLPNLVATAYVGTAAHHTWSFRFRNQASMEAKIKNLFDNLEASGPPQTTEYASIRVVAPHYGTAHH